MQVDGHESRLVRGQVGQRVEGRQARGQAGQRAGRQAGRHEGKQKQAVYHYYTGQQYGLELPTIMYLHVYRLDIQIICILHTVYSSKYNYR